MRDDKKTFSEILPGDDKLAPLDFVEASTFEGSTLAEQAVCDFVLTLALLHNDLNDLRWAFTQLVQRAHRLEPISPQAGRINGMREHCIRLLYALHHELLVLVYKNPAPQAHPLFQKTLNRISKLNAARWRSIMAAAAGKPKTDPMAMMLVRVRDGIASHYYGTELLADGFKKHYDGGNPCGRSLFVSRGPSLFTSRFYFADGAAESALRVLREKKVGALETDRLGELSNNTAGSIFAIVTRFMEDRAKGWQRYRRSA